jgi:hypothetical protein
MTTPIIYTPELFAPLDDLMERRGCLERAQNIPDMRRYAAAWLKLSRDVRSCGLRSNAEYCRARGKHYAGIARRHGGEYVRLFEMPLAELIEVG